MMRSLWSGVTGLQAHQIAMDVEGNNIANVNTNGFKYSRANFEDLIYQNSRIATAPQNKHGGVNGMQVGLGTQVQSTTKIFKQGSLQTTDKQTDIALQGDGFFMVSPDGGKTYYYTRNGDFSRDSEGNFVDNNGLIAQGWMRDEDTGEIDPTRPIENINIPRGLTIPAKTTTEINLVANLDSGKDVGTKKIPAYQLDQHHNWSDELKDGNKTSSEIHEENNVGNSRFYVNKNNEQRLKERGVDLGVLFNSNGDAYNLREGQGIWASYADAKTTPITLTTQNDGKLDAGGNSKTLDITVNGTRITGTARTVAEVAALINEQYSKTGVEAAVDSGGKGIVLVNKNNIGTTAATKNIKLKVNGGTVTGFTDTNIITAYQYTYSKTQVGYTGKYDDKVARQVTTTEDLRHAMQTDARLWTNYAHTTVPFNGTDPDETVFTSAASKAANKNDGVEITINEQGQFQIKNPKGDAYNTDDGDIRLDTNPLSPTYNTTVPGTPDANLNDHDMYLTVTGLTNTADGRNITENTKFTASLSPINGSLNSGDASRVSDGTYIAAHSSSTDIYDSLGTKHTIKMDFAKRGYTPNGGTEWNVIIQVAEPNTISDVEPKNVVTGYVRFNPDGSIATYSPASLTFGAQNGSAGGQTIRLNFGQTGTMTGLTSADDDSSTKDISQNGYASGDLTGVRIDQSGTLIGAFSNGKSLGLAQVAVAKFANNAGLSAEGGNLFGMTANSGEPIIGTAATAGRGSITASSLEMSNVDLSRSLTQLIVVQRGFQANSKTITTSDEMLNTLLQLK
jgi:flagellar hook protein FlgE